MTRPELVSLLREYNVALNTPLGSAALDWSALVQRLRFIAHFFRGYQEDGSLFDAPFNPAQLQAIADGRMPDRG